MKFVRGLLGLVAVVALLLGATALVARFHDGPLAIFPGGAFTSGTLYTGPEPDWEFARDIREMEFQLLDPPRSRVVWLLVHDHQLYLVSGYMNTTLGRWWKQWPAEAERDGRAVVRIDGTRYERELVRLHNRAQIRPLAAEARRKYEVPLTAEAAETGDAWFFRLDPRSS